jgi:hypothetical protein
MSSITCADPAPPPAIVRRAASPHPNVQRAVLRVTPRKPKAKTSPVRTLCALLPAAAQGPAPMLPHAEATTRLAELPSAPYGPAVALASVPEVEPLMFDAPGAGPERSWTWTLAAAPPPQWAAYQGPWTLAPLPVLPEPPRWMLAMLGAAVLCGTVKLRKGRT